MIRRHGSLSTLLAGRPDSLWELLDLGDPAKAAWMENAACRESNPELFFPVSEVGPGVRQVTEAKAVCGRCPVRSACLAFALERHLDGIWGGLTADERREMRRANRRVA